LKTERGAFFNSDFFTGITVSSLTFLAASLIPIVGAFIIILTPLPILYYYSKAGRTQGLTVFIISVSIVAVILSISGSITNLPFLLISGILGVTLSEIFRKNYSIELTVILPVMALMILWLSFILFQSLSLGKQPWNLVEDYIGINIQESIQFYTQLDIPAQQIDLIRDNAKKITSFFTYIFPALLLVSASFIVWINTLAAREIFQKYRMWYPDFGDLSRWKAPERLIWLLIANGILLLIPVEWATFLGLNLLIICLFLYMFQGLSIISFLFKTKKIHKVFRIPCYFLIFAQQYIIVLVIAVGVFDLWVDFRRYIKPITDTTT
jgi:uncharacterized protein YybS (DUF2232 family)